MAHDALPQAPFYTSLIKPAINLNHFKSLKSSESSFTETESRVTHQCDVVIESDQATPKGRLINAFIQVKDSNHKKIIIGHQGQTIKAISQEARKQIQIRLNTSLHLMLYVKQL